MPLSIDHLSEYLSQQKFRPSMELTWQRTEQSLPWKGAELPWNGLSCLSVVCYVLKFCSDSEHNDVMDTIRRLEDLVSEYNNTTTSEITFPVARSCYAESPCEYSPDFLMMNRYSNNDLTRSFQHPEKRQEFAETFVSTTTSEITFPLDTVCHAVAPSDYSSDFLMMNRYSNNDLTRSFRHPEKRQEFVETFVNTFLPKVQQFFIFDPKRNEHLAGFIHFLLQILNSESNHDQYERFVIFRHVLTVPNRNRQLTSFLQKISNCVPLGNSILQNIQIGLHMWLQRSLNFILTVLGDVPFQGDANSLMREFEDVANEVAHLIYACFFSTCLVNACQFSEHVVVLSQKFDLLKVKLQEHCVEISKLSIPICANPKNTNAADSQFIMDSLLEDLQNFMTSQNYLTSDMKQQTETLQSILEDMNVPEDQELKIQIRDTAYEAEYLLNSFVVRDFPAAYFSLRLPMIIEKFELIRKRCKEIHTVSDCKAVKVEDNHVEFPTQKIVPAPDNVIVGFEDEMMQILDELTGGSEDLLFICIYGMPGLGKSTLAKRLYNHRLITDRFDECAWCVVSQNYRRRNVLIDILTSLRRSTLDKENIMEMEDENLLLELHQTLFSRRYLIVIDDVWDSRIWDDVGRYLQNSRNGSRILFTTRIRDTAPENSIFHTLNFLSNDQCWELLEKKIFLDESCPPHLQDSGKRIAAKCNGLPLAVVAIAGALANMTSETRCFGLIY